MKILLFSLAAAAVLCPGCYSVGPFVTNISPDGQGNLLIEKNMVHVDGFTGVASMGENPTVQLIKIAH